MEMTDLKSAIEDYTDAAENGILGLKDRMDVLETKFARPGSAIDAASHDALEHKHAFLNGFITKGDDAALKQLEAKGLSTAGGDGGFAVPHVIDSEIEKQLRDMSPLRSICKVKTIETSNYTRLVSSAQAGMSGWVGEDAGRAETATPTLTEIAITPGEIYANAAATQRALDDMQFDAEAWLTEEVAEEFAAQEGKAFIDGDGVNKPKGFLHSSVVGSLGKVTTTASGDFDGPDNLVDLVHALKARYRQGAKFVMNSSTLAAVRKMKDGDGNFIWRPGLIEGQPDMLLGYPVIEAEDMPDMVGGAFPIAFGNFERGYTIVERTGTKVLRDPYTDKPNVLFYATKRVGGAVVNTEAIKLLELAA